MYLFKLFFIRSFLLLHIFLQSSRLDEYISIRCYERNIYSLNIHYGVKCSSKVTSQVSLLFTKKQNDKGHIFYNLSKKEKILVFLDSAKLIAVWKK